jgi:hypothetical protein
MDPHPPKPRLTLRVGVTGHRPDKLHVDATKHAQVWLPKVFEALAEAAMDIHARNKSAYSSETPAIRLVSGFAEGADQIAVAACPDGWTIEALLPFPKEDYLSDFEQSELDKRDVRDEFLACLEKADVITELPAPRSGDRVQGYADAGGFLLRQIDLLIAVWDGKAPKRGGTGALAREAFDGGIPVVWLSTREHNVPRLIKGFDKDTNAPIASGADCTKGPLTAELRPIFEVPSAARHGRRRSARAGLESFYAETWPPECRFTVYDMLKRFANRQKLRRVIESPNYDKLAGEWTPFLDDAPVVDNLRNRIETVLLPRYVWADALAVYYSHHYRSAYVLAYALSALAVFIALFGVFFDNAHVKAGLVVIEIGVIGSIIRIVRHGRRRLWHERWLDYRTVAEVLRHTRFVSYLSEFGRIYDSTPAAGQREPSWMVWYIRATMREIGLPTAKLDHNYQWKTLHATLTHEIDAQIAFHQSNSESSGRIDHFLHSFGNRCFVLTLWVIAGFLLIYFLDLAFGFFAPEGHIAKGLHDLLYCAKPITVFAAAWFPALGAAVAGIRVQGDFESSKERSVYMLDALGALKDDYNAVENDTKLNETAELLISTARMMSEDLAAWQELYGRKRLTLPA